ncbi:MAG: tRNA pseudouridine(38-40) synthase TruA [Bacteroidales bacterium]|nr:MAG: tRNA pseudouridine(38-40) synthase TruA [Bacteroidales bacterium]
MNRAGTTIVGSRYFIHLAFRGTDFHGWQIQPNGNTVQAEMNRALSAILKENIEVTGAGRTDTGVHARKFMAHFDTNQKEIQYSRLIYQLNGILPADIAVRNIKAVKSDAHARFDAISRTYEYHIHQQKDPFLDGYSCFYPGNLNIDKLNRGAELLYDYSDFSSFSKSDTNVKTNICNVMEANWIKESHRLIFTIKADRFLRNMVRAIVGTLLDAGSDKICLAEFRRIAELKDRSAAGKSVPAHGLYQTDIEYPERIFL